MQLAERADQGLDPAQRSLALSARLDAVEDQDGAVNPSIAQRDGLLQARYSKVPGTGRGEGATDGQCPVSVGVGLDDAYEDSRAAGSLPQGFIVAAERVQIDNRPAAHDSRI